MRSTRNFFVGTLTGLAIGLLAAPRSGQESRRWLKQEYDKRTKSSPGSSSSSGVKERLTTAFEQIKGLINKYVEQKKNHEKRLEDTGRFDYQLEREKRFYQQAPNPSAGSSAPDELHEHNPQITKE